MDKDLLWELISDAMENASYAFKNTEIDMEEEDKLMAEGIDIYDRVDVLWEEGFEDSYEYKGIPYILEPDCIPEFILKVGPYVIRLQTGYDGYGTYNIENLAKLEEKDAQMIQEVLAELFQ